MTAMTDLNTADLNVMTDALPITRINRKAGTQFRAEDNLDQIAYLMDLIQDETPWDTLIKVAKLNGQYILVDGFHRVQAYQNSGIEAIPAGQYEIIPCETLREVMHKAMTANRGHGKENVDADRLLMIEFLIKDEPKVYMNNKYQINNPALQKTLKLTRDQIKRLIGERNREGALQLDAMVLRIFNERDTSAPNDKYLIEDIMNATGLGDSAVRERVRALKAAESGLGADTQTGMEEPAQDETVNESNGGDGEEQAQTPTFGKFDVEAETGFPSQQTTHAKPVKDQATIRKEAQEAVLAKMEEWERIQKELTDAIAHCKSVGAEVPELVTE